MSGGGDDAVGGVGVDVIFGSLLDECTRFGPPDVDYPPKAKSERAFPAQCRLHRQASQSLEAGG